MSRQTCIGGYRLMDESLPPRKRESDGMEDIPPLPPLSVSPARPHRSESGLTLSHTELWARSRLGLLLLGCAPTALAALLANAAVELWPLLALG